MRIVFISVNRSELAKSDLTLDKALDRLPNTPRYLSLSPASAVVLKLNPQLWLGQPREPRIICDVLFLNDLFHAYRPSLFIMVTSLTCCIRDATDVTHPHLR